VKKNDLANVLIVLFKTPNVINNFKNFNSCTAFIIAFLRKMETKDEEKLNNILDENYHNSKFPGALSGLISKFYKTMKIDSSQINLNNKRRI
jgi:hypothetical protein